MRAIDLSFMYPGFKSKESTEIKKTSIFSKGDFIEELGWVLYRFWYWQIYFPITNFPKQVKEFIQRGKRGYSDKDLWSFDVYLANIIRDGLRDLAENNHGYPGKYKSIEQWNKKLNKTADAFDLWLKYFNMDDVPNTEISKTTSYWKKRQKKVEKNKEELHEFIEDLGNYWD